MCVCVCVCSFCCRVVVWVVHAKMCVLNTQNVTECVSVCFFFVCSLFFVLCSLFFVLCFLFFSRRRFFSTRTGDCWLCVYLLCCADCLLFSHFLFSVQLFSFLRPNERTRSYCFFVFLLFFVHPFFVFCVFWMRCVNDGFWWRLVYHSTMHWHTMGYTYNSFVSCCFRGSQYDSPVLSAYWYE